MCLQNLIISKRLQKVLHHCVCLPKSLLNTWKLHTRWTVSSPAWDPWKGRHDPCKSLEKKEKGGISDPHFPPLTTTTCYGTRQGLQEPMMPAWGEPTNPSFSDASHQWVVETPLCFCLPWWEHCKWTEAWLQGSGTMPAFQRTGSCFPAKLLLTLEMVDKILQMAENMEKRHKLLCPNLVSDAKKDSNSVVVSYIILLNVTLTFSNFSLLLFLFASITVK